MDPWNSDSYAPDPGFSDKFIFLTVYIRSIIGLFLKFTSSPMPSEALLNNS